MQREIRRWLADRFCPVGIVFSSPAVREQLLKFSSLGPAELLRPFSEVGNLGNVRELIKDFEKDFICTDFSEPNTESSILKVDSDSHLELGRKRGRRPKSISAD